MLNIDICFKCINKELISPYHSFDDLQNGTINCKMINSDMGMCRYCSHMPNGCNSCGLKIKFYDKIPKDCPFYTEHLLSMKQFESFNDLINYLRV